MVVLPLNIDDSQFDFHTEGPIKAQTGYTCVSMFLSCIDTYSNVTNSEFGIIGGKRSMVCCKKGMTNIHKDEYHAKMSEAEAPRPSNTTPLHAHADYPTTLKDATDRYLQYCDPNVDLHYVNILVVKLIILQKVLLSVMPMRRNASHTSHVDDVVFSQAIELLEIGQELNTNPRALPWSWASRVHWHSFGVVLAKLCVEPDSKLAARAWNVVEGSFIEYGKKVADSEKGMLWRPLEKLMIAARQAKAKLGGRTSSTVPSAIVNQIPLNTISQQQLQTQYAILDPSYPPWASDDTAILKHNNLSDGTAPAAALTTDFDMLSFQEPTHSSLDDLGIPSTDPVQTVLYGVAGTGPHS